MLISCLMVTQASRLRLARLAVNDFRRQTYASRELVIVHDGDVHCDLALRSLAAGEDAVIRVLRQPAGLPLGTLRNAAVTAAGGEFVCQWDDDDRYHPERLEHQWRELRKAGADFCFLCDQLHWFAASAEMYWDDWNLEPYPLNFVQGTLLGRRDAMPRYPELSRGEDTALVSELLRNKARIARVRDAGWCYVYVYHGDNAFELQHHAAISASKRYGQVRLLQRESLLRRRLGDYRPGFGSVRLPHEMGELVFGGEA